MIHPSNPESSAARALSIIIPTWNSGAHIDHCLEHLQYQDERCFEVILIDNGSRDYQTGQIPKAHPELVITEIGLPENRGFAAACNLGACQARGQWLAFLNADAFPEPGWLAAFQEGLRRFPEAGAFGSLILCDADPGKVDSAGDVYNISGIAWKGYGDYPLEAVPDRARRVFAPCAAAAFYRRDLFLEIGGFDEDFFSYFEDVDLGFRLNLKGYSCIALPDAIVRHVGSASTGRASDFAMYHYHRNLVWSYVKNVPGILFWLYLPAHILANTFFFLKYLRHGRGGVVGRAKRDAITGLTKMWEKRKKIQRARHAGIGEINQLLDKSLFAPYTIGKNLRRYYQEHGGAPPE